MSACGQGRSSPLVLDTLLVTTSTSVSPTSEPVTTPSTSALPQLGPWVDATANLAGIPSECGNISYVAADPSRDQVIAGVALQGLWGNSAGSDQWTKLGGEAPTQVMNHTATIVFDPQAPDRFWESGSYAAPGAVRTTNGGRSFDALGDIRHLDGLSVDLSDPRRSTLLAGSHESTSLYHSTDGGASWTDLGSHLPNGIGFASQPLVISSSVYLLGTYSWEPNPKSGLFRTTDGGASWQQVETGAVGGPPLVASDGSIYWPLQYGAGLVRSTDSGATWKLVTGGGALASSNVVELPGGLLASVGRTRLIVSDDRGTTWRAFGPPLPTSGAAGLTYSGTRKSIYIWQGDCGDKVPAGSIQRLDVSALTG